MRSGFAEARRRVSRWWGARDIQSLADMGNTFEIVRSLRPVPFTKDTVIRLIVITLLPVAPLALTLISAGGVAEEAAAGRALSGGTCWRALRLAVTGLVFERSVRTWADVVLFTVTSVELALLFVLTPAFTIVDGIYVVQHLLVLGIAFTRRPPVVQDRSLPAGAAVVVTYAYPYAQMICLRWMPGEPAWSSGGLVLVTLGACLSLASLVTLGQRFGVPGLAEPGDARPVSARAPPDVSCVYARGRGVQPRGVERRHRPASHGRMGLPALSYPRGGTNPVPGSRLACLRRLGALSSRPWALVGPGVTATPRDHGPLLPYANVSSGSSPWRRITASGQ